MEVVTGTPGDNADSGSGQSFVGLPVEATTLIAQRLDMCGPGTAEAAL
jgi:hypothetical protein